MSEATACALQFEELAGGNLALKPEKSKNATLGIVVEPVRDATLGLDYRWIRLRQQIGTIPNTTVIAQFQTFTSLFSPVA